MLAWNNNDDGHSNHYSNNNGDGDDDDDGDCYKQQHQQHRAESDTNGGLRTPETRPKVGARFGAGTGTRERGKRRGADG